MVVFLRLGKGFSGVKKLSTGTVLCLAVESYLPWEPLLGEKQVFLLSPLKNSGWVCGCAM